MPTGRVSSSASVHHAGGCGKHEHPAEVPLYYRGTTPIATCHWQWVGNILAARGVQNAWEMLGLSWGCRWTGGSVLFGIATWPGLFGKICGAEVSIMTFEGAEQAREAELRLNRNGIPFIAEIDSYYIPDAHREWTHAVHAVLVIHRDDVRVRFVDSAIGPGIMERSAREYELMRASPCIGRVEEHKLYSVGWSPIRPVEPDEIVNVVKSNLNVSFSKSQRLLERYIEWVEASEEPVDVCRAAGERYQATRLFDYLAQQKIESARRPAMLLSQLTNDWYLVHMLATNDHITDSRARQRIVRFLKRIAANEIELAEAVLK